MTKLRTALRGFTDAGLVEGTTTDDEREHQRRRRLIAEAMRSGLPEIERDSLAFGRHGIAEDTTTGRLYGVMRTGIGDAQWTPAIAFYFDSEGLPVYLERPAGPQTRDELAELRAKREQRKAEHAARRPSWTA